MSYENEVFQFVLGEASSIASCGYNTESMHHIFCEKTSSDINYNTFRKLFSISARIIGNIEYDRSLGYWLPTGNDRMNEILKEVKPMPENCVMESFLKAIETMSDSIVQKAAITLTQEKIEVMIQKAVKKEFDERISPAMMKNLESLVESTKQELSESIQAEVRDQLKSIFNNI